MEHLVVCLIGLLLILLIAQYFLRREGFYTDPATTVTAVDALAHYTTGQGATLAASTAIRLAGPATKLATTQGSYAGVLANDAGTAANAAVANLTKAKAVYDNILLAESKINPFILAVKAVNTSLATWTLVSSGAWTSTNLYTAATPPAAVAPATTQSPIVALLTTARDAAKAISDAATAANTAAVGIATATTGSAASALSTMTTVLNDAKSTFTLINGLKLVDVTSQTALDSLNTAIGTISIDSAGSSGTAVTAVAAATTAAAASDLTDSAAGAISISNFSVAALAVYTNFSNAVTAAGLTPTDIQLANIIKAVCSLDTVAVSAGTGVAGTVTYIPAQNIVTLLKARCGSSATSSTCDYLLDTTTAATILSTTSLIGHRAINYLDTAALATISATTVATNAGAVASAIVTAMPGGTTAAAAAATTSTGVTDDGKCSGYDASGHIIRVPCNGSPFNWTTGMPWTEWGDDDDNEEEEITVEEDDDSGIGQTLASLFGLSTGSTKTKKTTKTIKKLQQKANAAAGCDPDAGPSYDELLYKSLNADIRDTIRTELSKVQVSSGANLDECFKNISPANSQGKKFMKANEPFKNKATKATKATKEAWEGKNLDDYIRKDSVPCYGCSLPT